MTAVRDVRELFAAVTHPAPRALFVCLWQVVGSLCAFAANRFLVDRTSESGGPSMGIFAAHLGGDMYVILFFVITAPLTALAMYLWTVLVDNRPSLEKSLRDAVVALTLYVVALSAILLPVLLWDDTVRVLPVLWIMMVVPRVIRWPWRPEVMPQSKARPGFPRRGAGR